MDTLKELASQQQVLDEEVQRIIRNYKKDSSERKNAKYFKKHIEQLKNINDDFEVNDEKIRELPELAVEHPYFTEGYYEKICDIIKTYVNEFELMMTNIEMTEETGGFQAYKTISDTEIMRKFEAMINIVDRWCSTVMEDEKQYPGEVYNIKLKVIQDDWMNLKSLNLQMWEMCKTSSSIESAENKYMVLEGKITKINKVSDIKENNEITMSKAAQLPKITIPRFDGDYLKRPQFCDLFTEMIDKQNISKAQKMWYLNSSLSGEAAKLISHLPISTNNYMIVGV